jgi:hypothetical protein
MPIIFRERFDGPTEHVQGIQEITVPVGWEAFWYQGADETGTPRARPEMRVIADVPPYDDPPRVPKGESNALQWFTFFAPHACGIQRQIQVEPGQEIEARVLFHAWCSNGDDPHVSDQEDAYGMYARIGIDPTGNTNPRADTVAWSEQIYHFDAYGPLTVSTTAEADTITVFITTVAKWGTKHNDAYVADLQVSVPDAEPDPPNHEIAALLQDILTTLQAIEDLIEGAL